MNHFPDLLPELQQAPAPRLTPDDYALQEVMYTLVMEEKLKDYRYTDEEYAQAMEQDEEEKPLDWEIA